MSVGAERFDFRIIAWFCWASALILAPFAVLHAAQDDRLLTVLIAGLALLLVGTGCGVWRRRGYSSILLYTAVISSNLITLGAIHFVGAIAINWTYPLVAANLVFLQPRTGAAVNAALVTATLLLAAPWMPGAELGRVAATLLILTTCVYFFAHYVTRQQAELRALAALDPLTGTGNRRALQLSLEETVHWHRRYGGSVSLLVLDLDHFKQVNDTLGHDSGDRVLCEVVQLLKHRLRSTDRVFRYGGEEFIVIAPHTTLTRATLLADDIRHAIAAAHDLDHPVTASLGVVELLPDEEPAAWLKRGDQALYQAKAQGRNRTVVSDAGDHPRIDLSVAEQYQTG